MTLDEAIAHAEEVARSCQWKAYDIERDDYPDLKECAEEHRQLAEWLRELKELRDKKPNVGKWIRGQCSVCCGQAPFWPMASTYYKSKFCPTCGSQMNGGEQDEIGS